MGKFSDVFNKITSKKIGICLEWELPPLTEDLKALAHKYDLVIYGLPVEGLAHSGNSGDPSMDIIEDYKEGKIDGFVRGINDDYTFQKKYKKELSIDRLMRLAFMKDVHGREFCLGPISASEAVDAKDRLNFALVACKFMKMMGIVPSVAVMSACRPGSVNYSESNAESWAESDMIVNRLREAGFEAENVGIELEKSVGRYDFVLPVRGIIGNQMFRTLTFLGGGEVLGVPAFSIADPTLCYEDNSRNEESYETHIKAAILWSNLKKL